MTLSVYLIHHWSAMNNDFTKEINEIEQINPDKIVLCCFEEIDADYIFHRLFPLLSPWLVKNNKVAKVLVINPNNKELSTNIITEKTFGFQLSIYQVYLNFESQDKPFEFEEAYKYATKLYTCYNNHMKYHRVYTIERLIEENLFDQGIITVHLPNKIHPEDFPPHRKIDWKLYDGSVKIDEENFFAMTDSTMIPPSYMYGLIDIVTETQIAESKLFLTEKTAKSIISLKPFLSVSSQHFHSYILDEYGIEPYTEIFDYSFDTMTDVQDRVNGIVENVKRLKNLMYDTTYRSEVFEKLMPKLKANKQRLIDYTFNKEKMVPESLKFSTEHTDYKLYGDVDKCRYVFDFYNRMGWLAK